MSLAIVRRHVSNGANFLAEALGVRKFYPEGAHLSSAKFLLNWGSSADIPVFKKHRIINPPSAVGKAVDKGVTLAILQANDIPCVKFGTNAKNMRLAYPGRTLFARTLTRASRGRGIVVLKPEDPIVPAGLYTLYEPLRTEYRVHWGFDKFLIQQKKRRNGARMTEQQMMVRSGVDNDGWVFCINDVDYNEAEKLALVKIARDGIQALGLHFGAADILQTEDGRFMICEINTAPAIETPSERTHYVSIFEGFAK